MKKMASPARFERLDPRIESVRYIRRKTVNMVTGKAKENIFNVGADRLITPTATLARSKTITVGSIITVAILNINPADDIPAVIIRSPLGKCPMGKKM